MMYESDRPLRTPEDEEDMLATCYAPFQSPLTAGRRLLQETDLSNETETLSNQDRS